MKLEFILEQLRGVKKYHNLTWDDIRDELRKQGIKSIGMGRYGEVFHKPDWNYVIKVFESDDAYLDYVNFCITNNNPHFPKFIKKPKSFHQFHKRLHHSSKMLQIVKMELLAPLKDHWYSDNLENICNLIFRENIKNVVIYDDDITKPKMYDNIEDIINDNNNKPQLRELISALVQIKNKFNSYILDIHSENLMQRKDGTIVITDPIVNPKARRGFLNNDQDGEYYYDDQGQGLEAGPKYKNTMKQLIMDFS